MRTLRVKALTYEFRGGGTIQRITKTLYIESGASKSGLDALKENTGNVLHKKKDIFNQGDYEAKYPFL